MLNDSLEYIFKRMRELDLKENTQSGVFFFKLNSLKQDNVMHDPKKKRKKKTRNLSNLFLQEKLL